MSAFPEHVHGRDAVRQQPQPESSLAGFSQNELSGARAAIVNRTHRVVRERAVAMQKRRSSVRNLALPLLICSAVMLMVCYAIWTVVSGTGFGAVGTEIQEEAGRLITGQTMDTGGPVYLLLIWFLPISAVTLVMVLFRRSRGRADDEVTR